LFIAIGKPKEATKINLAYVVVLVIALSRLTGQFGAVGAAYSMLIATIVSTPLYLIRLRKFIGEPVMRFFVATIRPTIASLVMILAVRSTLPEYQMGLSAFNGIKTLIVAIGIGVVSYAFTLVALWGIFGKGEGAERLVLDKLRLRYDWVLHRIQQKVGK
jgi:O-antigen/teichoic acid export membrane protein